MLLAASTLALSALFIALATATAGVFMAGAARGWRAERDATDTALRRLQREMGEERKEQAKNVERLQAQFEAEREQQRIVRHDLKDELAALRKVRDPTEVLQNVLAKLDSASATVASLLERAEERAALRDEMIVATQREMIDRLDRQTAALERLTDRIVGQVAEVVQQKVDQLQPDPPRD